MKELPVIHSAELEKQLLEQRVALSNRPKLTQDRTKIENLATSLSNNVEDRKQFLLDPITYLRDRDVMVKNDTKFLSSTVPGETTTSSVVFTAAALLYIVLATSALVALTAIAVVNVAVGVALIEVVAVVAYGCDCESSSLQLMPFSSTFV